MARSQLSLPIYRNEVSEARNRPALKLALGGTLVVYLLCLCFGTHVPLDHLPITIHNDVLYHFAAYFVLATIVFLVFRERAEKHGGNIGQQTFKAGLIVWGVVVLIAVADESTQPLFGRNFQWKDIAADFAGAALAVMVMSVASQFVTLLARRRRRSDRAKRTTARRPAARPTVSRPRWPSEQRRQAVAFRSARPQARR